MSTRIACTEVYCVFFLFAIKKNIYAIKLTATSASARVISGKFVQRQGIV